MGVNDRLFGRRPREARVQAGFSQSELEERSGIPKARLSRYENGHVIPSIQTLERLAGALQVSEASLLGDRRAMLEEFFLVLEDRGVPIRTSEQGARLANALADLLQAVGAAGADPEPRGSFSTPVAASAVASVRQWIKEDGQVGAAPSGYLEVGTEPGGAAAG